MSLGDDLDRIGTAAAQFAAPGEQVTAVLAAEPSGGARLAELREHEHPAGIEEAEAAAAALADALAAEPRVATTAFLDEVGALARTLEHALGTDSVSPFGTAMQQAMPAVEELAADVERNYKADTR